MRKRCICVSALFHSLFPNKKRKSVFTPEQICYNKLIIPPDLFYGLNATIDSTDTYNRSQGVYKALSCNTPLNGIVPTNIFKNNKTVRCDYLWEN